MLREVKPKTARGARVLKQREPHMLENPKKVLFLKSTSSSALNNAIMSDLYSLKRPLATRFTKKNPIHPFEDASSLEFFSQKNDASLLCFASHSKKRPHNLTLVRTFDAKILDMIELLIDPDTTRTMSQFGSTKSRVGIKPMLSFSGPFFERDDESTLRFRLAKSLLIDFFRGDTATQIDVEGLQTLISFTGSETPTLGKQNQQIVHMRVWRLITRRSGQKLPRVELEEMGPRVDIRLGRMQEADASLRNESLKRSTLSETKSKKNIETDLMGDKIGRIHMLKQDFEDLQTRKMKGLKRSLDEGSLIQGPESVSSSDNEGFIVSKKDITSTYDNYETNSTSQDEETQSVDSEKSISKSKRRRLT